MRSGRTRAWGGVLVVGVAIAVAACAPPPSFVYKGCSFGPFNGFEKTLTFTCPGMDISGVNLSLSQVILLSAAGANLSGSSFFGSTVLGGVLSDADLSHADFRYGELVEIPAAARVDFTGARFEGTTFSAVDIQESNFTRTIFLPGDQTVPAPGPDGAVVTWTAPPPGLGVDGPVLGACDHASGSVFPVGVTTVRCDVTIGANPGNFGTFTVTVLP